MHEEYLKYIKSYKPKEPLIREGEADSDFFCLLQGKVGIWKGDISRPDVAVKVTEIDEKGTYFGEMSALLSEQRTASIVAMDAVKVLKFPGEMLPQLIAKQPKLGLKLCSALADRLKGTTNSSQSIANERNELRDDATQHFMQTREAFQKVWVLITALQMQLQNPNLKSIIEYMSHDKLLQGGKKLHLSSEFLDEIPSELAVLVKKAYAEILQ